MDNPDSIFIADVHLGKLARLLRMTGFDTLHHSAHTLPELLAIASAQNRILLSRNGAIARAPLVECVLITSNDSLVQFKSLISPSLLTNNSKHFSRCLVCNGTLISVPKGTVLAFLEPKTAQFYNDFWQCPDCSKVYWKGPHYLRMQRIIESMNLSS